MNRKRILFFLLFVLLTISVMPAAAQGIIVPPPGIDTDPSTLIIDYHRVKVEIENQIATTNVDMQFTNKGERFAEGTFIFPLPAGATVDNLIMYVDGVAVEGKILSADQARDIYIETVRRLVDPALLEYVGTNAIQARIFPIPAGESRRIEISYSQVLEVDNGLLHYVYPLNTAGTTARSMGQMSVSVHVVSNDPISNIYSPSHNIAFSRPTDKEFRAGFEATNYVPDSDFSLYYGISSDTISVNLLTYRESANEDGFFMLLVQPPVSVPDEQVAPKDVIIVLDQSGSMQVEKWDQAREAAAYVLSNLKPQDKFNVITFSTGWRIYANEMLPASEAPGAAEWIKGLYAEGGTDINGALTTALDMVHPERTTTILFMTDGLATEGVTETSAILENLQAKARPNVRIFTFGVGDDVDTFLLDAIIRNHRGTGTYVRPNERINEEVASLYNKISAPVLTNIDLTFGGSVVTELMYPHTLSDIFAGEQLTIVGRYRGSADGVSVTLSGTVNGEKQTFVYDNQSFRGFAGGESFIARLWATRRIGDLLNTIRLNGENQELIDSIVSLSIRYGIITPYTSFLIEEDDILTERGRAAAAQSFAGEAEGLADDFTGADAVEAADAAASMENANAPMLAMPTQTAVGGAGGPGGNEEADENGIYRVDADKSVNPIQTVKGKTFILQGEVWTDTTFTPDTMETTKVVFLSDEYFDLLLEHPELSDYFAVGERVIVVLDGTAYEVVTE